MGLTGDKFKIRYGNHLKSFKNTKYKNETCLSKYIWDLKERNIQYDIKWEILDKGSVFSPITERFNLCLKEKYYLIIKPELASINTINEVIK